MKYRGKKYKWYTILFVDNEVAQVELYNKAPWEYMGKEGMSTVTWDSEKLTDKPVIFINQINHT